MHTSQSNYSNQSRGGSLNSSLWLMKRTASPTTDQPAALSEMSEAVDRPAAKQPSAFLEESKAVAGPAMDQPSERSETADRPTKNQLAAFFEKSEAVERRAELLVPESRENFLANLWWMIEQGVEEDLDALRRIKDNLPYLGKDIDELMTIAEQRITERVNDPDYITKTGEEAYKAQARQWEREYAGQFIAIHRRQVVASAPTQDELWPRLKEAQREKGPFRAYIVKVGLKMPTFTGPRMQLEKMRVRELLLSSCKDESAND